MLLGVFLSSSLSVLCVTKSVEGFAAIVYSAIFLLWLFFTHVGYKYYEHAEVGLWRLCVLTVFASVGFMVFTLLCLAPKGPGVLGFAVILCFYTSFPIIFCGGGLSLGYLSKQIVLDRNGVRTSLETLLRNPIVKVLVSAFLAVIATAW